MTRTSADDQPAAGTVEAVRFVDVHSHVVPSGDDGVATVEEGLELCREAARRGTRVLYATPHVWPFDGLSSEREEAVRRAHDAMARETAAFGLTLGLGFELTPAEALLDESLERYALGGIDRCDAARRGALHRRAASFRRRLRASGA